MKIKLRKGFIEKNRFLIAGVVTVALILSVGFFFYLRVNAFSKRKLMASTKITAESVANYLEIILNETVNTSRLLGSTRSVVQFFGFEGYKSLGVVNEVLDRYESGESKIYYLMNLDGLTLASSNRNAADSFVGKNYAFRPYFKQALLHGKSYYFALGVTSGLRGFYAATAIKEITGKIVGVAVVKRRLDENAKYLKKFKEYFFVNEEGIVFISSDPKYVLRSICGLSKQKAEKIKESKQFGRGPFKPLFDSSLKDGDEVTFKGKGMLVTIVSVGDFGWRVVLLESTNDIFIHELLVIIPSIVLCLLFIVFFFYMSQKDQFVRNLRRSEQRYTSIFETGPQITIILDLKGKMIFCSKRIEEILGYTVSETLGNPGFDFILKEDVEKAGQFLEEVIMSREIGTCVLRGIHKNGSIHNISLTASLMPGQSEYDPTSIVCVIEDVTKRFLNENKLRESKEQYEKVAQENRLTQEATLNILEDLQETKESVEADRRGFLNIVENSWNGIVIVDDMGMVRFVNKSAQSICDAEAVEMVGRPFAHAINADKIERFNIAHKDGKNVLVEIRVTQTEWMQQKMNLVVMHDITQQEKEVLIIDDERDFCLLVKSNLESTGEFKVSIAHNATEAMNIAKAQKPDIILLDMMMPLISGGELATALRKEETTKDIPIIFLTAVLTKEEVGKTMRKMGDKRYIAKPVKTQELIDSIKQVINNKP